MASAAASLPRSSVSFRRQGSSGLIWEDRFFSSELTQTKTKKEEDGSEFRELRRGQSTGSIGMLERSRSGGRTSRKVSPEIDPPSPKVSACGFCSMFRKPSQPSRHTKRSKR